MLIDEFYMPFPDLLILQAKSPEERDKLVRELQDYVRRKTAPYKYPRKIEFVKALPKTVSGKIKRAVLRERELRGSS